MKTEIEKINIENKIGYDDTLINITNSPESIIPFPAYFDISNTFCRVRKFLKKSKKEMALFLDISFKEYCDFEMNKLDRIFLQNNESLTNYKILPVIEPRFIFWLGKMEIFMKTNKTKRNKK